LATRPVAWPTTSAKNFRKRRASYDPQPKTWREPPKAFETTALAISLNASTGLRAGGLERRSPERLLRDLHFRDS
jgi:hypothetical protein